MTPVIPCKFTPTHWVPSPALDHDRCSLIWRSVFTALYSICCELDHTSRASRARDHDRHRSRDDLRPDSRRQQEGSTGRSEDAISVGINSLCRFSATDPTATIHFRSRCYQHGRRVYIYIYIYRGVDGRRNGFPDQQYSNRTEQNNGHGRQLAASGVLACNRLISQL